MYQNKSNHTPPESLATTENRMDGRGDELLRLGARVIAVEIQALSDLIPRLDYNFAVACELMMSCQGRIIVMGMGKSGHIAGKIAATLASTGTPAFFVHPAEAGHGDLGMITARDIVLALSNSGETSELLTILPVIKRIGAQLIAMTGNKASTLARHGNVHIDIGTPDEACPLGLAPTSSTTASLAMGDALAVTLLQAKGFTREDFAFSHPGGNIGKRLFLRVQDIMHTGEEIPRIAQHARIRDALLEMTTKKLGMTAIVDDNERVVGIFTDGDLRRLLERATDIHTTAISEAMTRAFTHIAQDCLASEALYIMEEKRINALLVINENAQLTGAINMQDLLKSGIF
jgi:arabinose-5-phosphate isomerase